MGHAPSVTVERRPDEVALVRIDRPRANALSADVLGQLRAVVDDLAADPPGAVVVWGGPRMFAAGADIVELGEGGPGAVADHFHDALGALAALPRATVAAVNGYALGGGLELALACDLRVCAEDARLGLPEVLLGVIPGGGGTQRLPRLVGPARAKDLILTGRQVRGPEALAIGLADRVMPAGGVLETALGLAAELARGAVLAHALAKEALDGGTDLSLAESLQLERSCFLTACATEDAATGIRSFLDRGPGKAFFAGR